MTTQNESITPVAGFLNGMYCADADSDAAMRAVIVNPAASESEKLAWALGQLYLLKSVAEMVDPAGEDQAMANLACATRCLLEQSMGVIEGVRKNLSRSVAPDASPLRLV